MPTIDAFVDSILHLLRHLRARCLQHIVNRSVRRSLTVRQGTMPGGVRCGLLAWNAMVAAPLGPRAARRCRGTRMSVGGR